MPSAVEPKKPRRPRRRSASARSRRSGVGWARTACTRAAAHVGSCNTWLFKELDRPRAPHEDGKTAAAAVGGKDKKKDKDKKKGKLRSYGIEPCLI